LDLEQLSHHTKKLVSAEKLEENAKKTLSVRRCEKLEMIVPANQFIKKVTIFRQKRILSNASGLGLVSLHYQFIHYYPSVAGFSSGKHRASYPYIPFRV
jgi:hypothetical protein